MNTIGITSSSLRPIYDYKNQSYVFGGVTGFGYISSIEYINDTETISNNGFMQTARSYFASSVNKNFIYLFGGFNGESVRSSAEKFDGSTTQSISSMTTSRFFITGMYSKNNGYAVGGWDGSFNQLSSTEKLNFSNETFSQLAVGGSSSQSSHSIPDFGLLVGGFNPGITNNHQQIYKLNFSTETISLESNYSSSLGTATSSGAGNRNTGYFSAGGSALIKINLYNLTSNAGINLGTTRKYPAGMLSRTDGVIVSGGSDDSQSNYLNSSQKVNYSNDSYSSSVNMSISRASGAGISKI